MEGEDDATCEGVALVSGVKSCEKAEADLFDLDAALEDLSAQRGDSGLIAPPQRQGDLDATAQDVCAHAVSVKHHKGEVGNGEAFGEGEFGLCVSQMSVGKL